MKSKNDSDKKRYAYYTDKFFDKYIDLHKNLNFPPLILSKNDFAALEYQSALAEAYRAGLELPEIDFITGDAKPFNDFEKKFSKQIAEAKKFRTASNGNAHLALQMYAEQTGEELHESEYIGIGKYRP